MVSPDSQAVSGKRLEGQAQISARLLKHLHYKIYGMSTFCERTVDAARGAVRAKFHFFKLQILRT